ncbi:MAG TPA: F0F1 ATP synthase subunit delta [Candidatus Saccharimonadales bacterium]|nr:F0F1 ATP synthase subunit delta [Candidatus Saccharimonadales bacterium]
MKQSRAKLAKLVADKTINGRTSDMFIKELAAYLLSERRVNELNSLVRDVQADWADQGFVEVIASSEHQLTDAVKHHIVDAIKPLYPRASSIKVSENHDSSVIGGVRLNLPEHQLDLTVKAKLDTFKHLAANGDYS